MMKKSKRKAKLKPKVTLTPATVKFELKQPLRSITDVEKYPNRGEIDGGSKPATTTVEEDLHTASQRAINKTWEITQAVVAIMVTLSALSVSSYSALVGKGESSFVLLSNAFFLVIGFYFGRTNHQRVGGIQLGR